ncbi:MAG: cation:proton antiporter [Candidatus Symbiothrix sp.]|jgi:CPA1 family monovalent cation:H+ antiporter|nr:cation:proton antiporter [Candidatus Symbiothrix sp.]
MESYSIIIILLAVSIGLVPVASKLKLPYPILLLAAGIAFGFIPGFHWIAINPEVVFLIFLPPMLYDAAYNISFKDFRANLPTISLLAITLVFVTTIGIAVVAHYCIPGMTWPLAFVLGAILSPPDAVAAAGVTKGLGLPHRACTILEGESLINDASALVAFRFAVAAVAGSSFIPWKAGLMFVVSLGGGCIVGFILWLVFAVVVKKIRLNSTVLVSLNLLLPFVAYLIAEEFHVSGVISVVTAGLIAAQHKDQLFSQQAKIQSKSVWDTSIFLLNGLVFIFIGLEFPAVLRSIQNEESIELLIVCAFLIFFVALAIRVLIVIRHKFNIEKRMTSIKRKYPFLFGGQKTNNPKEEKQMAALKEKHPAFYERKKRQIEDLKDIQALGWKESLIIGWSGMRGIVSLAAALSLPLLMADSSAFPLRDTIVFLTVVVVIIMLMVQGLGLLVLVKLLKIDKNKKFPIP